MMNIDVLTLFPEMFEGVLGSSILKKATEQNAVTYNITNFRDFADNKHKTVDDYPYGGGAGMVLKPQPIFDAVTHLRDKAEGKAPRVILLCPQGKPYNQKLAESLAEEEHLIFICGHYEGYDERIRQHVVTDEVSLGDYVLTGGELGAMVMIDSIVRLLPNVLGNETSHKEDSFSTGLLEHPHYTRPANFRGMMVPEVLTSGNHRLIEEWRQKESIKRTLQRRPDLLNSIQLSPQQKKWIEQYKNDVKSY